MIGYYTLVFRPCRASAIHCLLIEGDRWKIQVKFPHVPGCFTIKKILEEQPLNCTEAKIKVWVRMKNKLKDILHPEISQLMELISFLAELHRPGVLCVTLAKVKNCGA